MSTTTAAAALTVIAFFVSSVTAAYLLIRRAMRHEARHHQFLREQAETTRQVDELELLYSLPAHDPAWAAGMERLWDAIRDEQHKEEQ